MNHFTIKRKHSYFFLFNIVLILLCILVLNHGIHMASKGNLHQQKILLTQAISRDLTQCYALEGFYPEDLSYFKEHYGLTYDTDVFFVDYNFVASNLRPDVTVIERK